LCFLCHHTRRSHELTVSIIGGFFCKSTPSVRVFNASLLRGREINRVSCLCYVTALCRSPICCSRPSCFVLALRRQRRGWCPCWTQRAEAWALECRSLISVPKKHPFHPIPFKSGMYNYILSSLFTSTIQHLTERRTETQFIQHSQNIRIGSSPEGTQVDTARTQLTRSLHQANSVCQGSI
jgi:hypothetical protein